MSTVKVTVAPVGNIRPHPNAELLDLATVKGWQMGVKRGAFREGQPVVYFEQGTVLPPEVAERFGVRKYLVPREDIGGNQVLVVHRVRLRGEPSFGLVVEPEPGMVLGQDVSAHYGATKYRPPAPDAPDAEEDHPAFPSYTEVENMRTYPDIFQDGEEVVAAEKLDGKNGRLGFVRGEDAQGRPQMELMAGSRTLRRKRPAENLSDSMFWAPHLIPGVKSLLDVVYNSGVSSFALFGELHGPGVRSLHYGRTEVGFRVFDMCIDGKYASYATLEETCQLFGIEMVPLVYRGPFSLAKIRDLSDGPTLLGGSHGREGVVVRPVVERTHPEVGRVILKYVGDAYLFGKAAEKDATDL